MSVMQALRKKLENKGILNLPELVDVEDRIAELKDELAEKPQALIDVNADDINEHLIQRANDAEKALERVRNFFPICGEVQCMKHYSGLKSAIKGEKS